VLKLDTHGYSAAVLQKIVEAGGQLKSFDLASEMLGLLAEFSISAMHVARVTEEIGTELARARDQHTEEWTHYRAEPEANTAPEAVAVCVDGGRIMTRAPGHGRGVHERGWKEDKVACLHTLSGPTFEQDPHPAPPRCFLDPEHVQELTRDLKAQKQLPGCDGELPGKQCTSMPATKELRPPAEEAWPPKREVRTCVATMADSDQFGRMVAAEAHRRNFQAAGRRAFLADGLLYNWTIHRKWFKEYEPITDFIHPLAYLYSAAGAVSENEAIRWQRYVEWVTACWQGRIAEVIEAIQGHRDRLQPIKSEETPLPSDPRVVLDATLRYLGNNQPRMDYPRYRRIGLPVTSCAVESLIKEINHRVKGTEKFWNRPDNAEAILQIRAVLLGDDHRLARHLAARPGHPYRRRRSLQNGKLALAA